MVIKSNLTLTILLMFISCAISEKKSLNCPIGHFGLGWNQMAYETLGRFEGELTPCEVFEDGFWEKEILFAIYKDGTGEIELYGKPLVLKSFPPIIDKGTIFWEQSFFNDTFSIKINIQNKQLVPKEMRYQESYTYSSIMTLSIKDTFFTYKLIGICDSVGIDRLCNKTKKK